MSPGLPRTAACVKRTLNTLIDKFRVANNFVNGSGNGVFDVSGTDTLEKVLLRKCKYFYILEPVFGNSPRARPLMTTESDGFAPSESDLNQTTRAQRALAPRGKAAREAFVHRHQPMRRQQEEELITLGQHTPATQDTVLDDEGSHTCTKLMDPSLPVSVTTAATITPGVTVTTNQEGGARGPPSSPSSKIVSLSTKKSAHKSHYHPAEERFHGISDDLWSHDSDFVTPPHVIQKRIEREDNELADLAALATNFGGFDEDEVLVDKKKPDAAAGVVTKPSPSEHTQLYKKDRLKRMEAEMMGPNRANQLVRNRMKKRSKASSSGSTAGGRSPLSTATSKGSNNVIDLDAMKEQDAKMDMLREEEMRLKIELLRKQHKNEDRRMALAERQQQMEE